jgi:phosphoribosylglycinamide formyltransferase-1
MRPFRLAVLVSGEGSNLQAILDSVHGREGIEVACVGASRPDACALERAREAGVPTGVFAASDHPDRAVRDEALAEFLTAHEVDLVVLAGFMELLDPAFVRRFDGRMINVHPSLLPAFPGLRAIEQALDYGVRVTGVTVHFVDEGVDTGAIVAQAAIELPYAPDIARVEEMVHAVEHRLLPEAIRLIARGGVRIELAEPGARRRVNLEREPNGER